MEYGRRPPRGRSGHAGISLRVAFLVASIAALHAMVSAAGAPSVRAFWVPSSALTSAAAVQRAVTAAIAGRFDAVMAPVVVGSRDSASTFDGTGELLRQARDGGLRAHLAVAVNVAASVGELPAARDHVLYQHPEWLMVPREIGAEMLKVDARSPAYLGQIARWTRANADRVDGLYISPADPAAAAYVVATVVEAVSKYAVDGVYFSGLDLPGPDFDYSRHTMDIFRSRMRSALSAAERQRVDEVESIDPFAYAEEFPEEWARFREAALTQLLERLRSALTAVRPALSVAAAVRADAGVSLRDHFQDWRSWLDRGLVDRVGPRRGSAPAVVLSTDGVQPADQPPPVSTAQAGIGAPR